MDLVTEAQDGTLTRLGLEKYLRLARIDDEHPTTGFTPLAAAVYEGHASVVRLLLERNADANKPIRDGRTPLYLAANAKENRPLIVDLLLKHGAKVDGGWGNETPLMVAITQARDPEAIELLVEAGASLSKENDKSENAQFLADTSSNPAIKNAILPKDQRVQGKAELTTAIVNLVMFILAYVNSGFIKDVLKGVVTGLYGMVGSSQPDSTIAKAGRPDDVFEIQILTIWVLQEIGNPQTKADFKTNINSYVAKNGLDKFFPPGDKYIEELAAKAVELKNDPSNPLSSVDQIRDLTSLAMYQPVLYCDDSGSMREGTRMQSQTNLVKRMGSIATRAVPDKSGVHLRFINKSDGADNIDAIELDRKMAFTPRGGTRIGTSLRDKILKPFIYNVLDGGDNLKRPYLVLTITDGEPWEEKKDEFRNAVVECRQKVVQKGYRPQAVLFSVSQVGSQKQAEEFLDSLEEDRAVADVLHRTAGHLDEKYEELRENEKDLEIWLLKLLMSPVKPKP
ncbi:hypothetical protein MMC29_004186 [Sticta canariensis]|nr:hypothetical protein [Sticta canariensis]